MGLLQGSSLHQGLSPGRQTEPLPCLHCHGSSEVAPDVHPMAPSSCSSQRNVPLPSAPSWSEHIAHLRSPPLQQGLAWLPVPRGSSHNGRGTSHCPWNRPPHLPQGYQQTVFKYVDLNNFTLSHIQSMLQQNWIWRDFIEGLTCHLAEKKNSKFCPFNHSLCIGIHELLLLFIFLI